MSGAANLGQSHGLNLEAIAREAGFTESCRHFASGHVIFRQTADTVYLAAFANAVLEAAAERCEQKALGYHYDDERPGPDEYAEAVRALKVKP